MDRAARRILPMGADEQTEEESTAAEDTQEAGPDREGLTNTDIKYDRETQISAPRVTRLNYLLKRWMII